MLPIHVNTKLNTASFPKSTETAESSQLICLPEHPSRPADLYHIVPLLHNSRNAAEMGSRAARMAGNKPPAKPISADQAMPRQSNSGVTLKANATWLKLCQFIVEV